MRDVVIVGAGPVGVFLAALLAQRGVDVLVVDRRTEPSGSSRAIGIHPPSMAALASIGLAEGVLRECVAIRRGIARSGGRILGEVRLDAVSSSFPFVVALPQHRSQALLESRLADLAPSALRRGVLVTGLRQDGDSATLSCESAAGAFEVTSRFVIAADGAHSFLRGAAGIATRRRPYPDAYVMGDFADDTGEGPVAVVHLERRGVVESFPLPGSIRRWVVRTDGLLSDATPEDLAALVRKRTGVGIDASTNSMLSAFRVRRQVPERLLDGRLVLVGDAAHEVSPIGGQGMNLGWLDAVTLAPLLAASVGSAGPDLTALRRWETTRRHSANAAARLSEANMALGRPARGLTLAARNLLVAALLRLPTGRLLARAYAMAWA